MRSGFLQPMDVCSPGDLPTSSNKFICNQSCDGIMPLDARAVGTGIFLEDVGLCFHIVTAGCNVAPQIHWFPEGNVLVSWRLLPLTVNRPVSSCINCT